MTDHRGVVISQRGADALRAELQSRKQKLTTEQRKAGETRAACHAGNTSSGCVISTEIDRQHQIDSERIQELEDILSQASVAARPTDKSVLRMGLIGTWSYLEGRAEARAQGREQRWHVHETYEIVGFREGDCFASPRRISYDANLVKPFIGQGVGYKETFYRDGEPFTRKLIKIQFPSD